jgi:hypothetical protein
VIFLFNVMKGMRMISKGRSLGNMEMFWNERHFQRVNEGRYLISLILAFVIQFFKRLYRNKKNSLHRDFRVLPRELWKNDFPIVMVHGFGGYSPDESIFFGDYFGYASDPAT